jgi:hypothetical protein
MAATVTVAASYTTPRGTTRQRGQSAGVQAVDIGINMVSALAFS